MSKLKRKMLRRLLGKGIIDGPIVVYQMGKVGSTTVHESLKASNLRVPIHHCHLLNNLDEIEETIRNSRPDPTQTISQVEKSRQLREDILGGCERRWNLVSLVREPVKRNISAFFQNLPEIIPGIYETDVENQISIHELSKIFIEQYIHNAPLDWFDTQVKDVFGIDVFKSEFNREKGYSIYKYGNCRLLVIRLENLEHCIQAAMWEFLRLPDFQLINSNLAVTKEYSVLYQKFCDEVSLPLAYLDWMYESKFARHFYSNEEINKFRLSWIRKNG